MKLRIARKMDQKPKHYPGYKPDKRVWWKVYNGEQLLCAERRLARSWQTACPITYDAEGKGYRTVVEDFFRMNRVHSRRVRRGALRRMHRELAEQRATVTDDDNET